jgi:peptidoglycan/LPS O-acetylase OafA/YrhL
MWLIDVNDSMKSPFPDRPAFVAVTKIHDALKPTPLFRAGTWLLLCIAICGFGWSRRDRPEGAYLIGVCGSAVVYVLTFYAVGVASDFRYAYWAVVASLTGAVVAAASALRRRSAKTAPS